MRNILTIFLLIFSAQVLSEELKCGQTNVSIEKTGQWENTRYQVIAQLKDRKTELWLNSIDHLSSQCVLDSKNRDKILINAHCGGSGCSEHTYTIIDAQTLMVELVPVKGKSNLIQAEEIIGRAIK